MSAPTDIVERTGAEEPLIPERIARFLGALPSTFDEFQWIVQFRDALQELLGDVDRIACSIDRSCNPLAPRDLLQFHTTGIEQIRDAGNPDAVQLRVRVPSESTAQSMLRQLPAIGLHVRQFHPPSVYEYYHGGTDYIATILLLRSKDRPPISERTHQALASLHPFLLTMFTSYVARYAYEHPMENLFTHIIDRIIKNFELSTAETAVLALQLYGFTYPRIAEKLHITVNTVAKHVKSIHRKTGCASYLELFGRYVARADEAHGNGGDSGAVDGIVAVY